jgi:hypothetical protein
VAWPEGESKGGRCWVAEGGGGVTCLAESLFGVLGDGA